MSGKEHLIFKIIDVLKELAEVQSSVESEQGKKINADGLEVQMGNLRKIIQIIVKKHTEMLDRIKKLENYIQTVKMTDIESSVPIKKVITEPPLSITESICNRPIDEKLRMGVLQSKMPTLWIPDDFSNRCQNCCTGFGCFFSRRDHCRMCGGLFCTDCVANYAYVPPFYINCKVPVCDLCFKQRNII